MNFTLITTIFAFKRKKCEKVRVVKAHIGGKIMTFIVQDRKKNIQPGASDSNSESATDSYRVYRQISDIARDTSILQSDLSHLRNWSEV